MSIQLFACLYVNGFVELFFSSFVLLSFCFFYLLLIVTSFLVNRDIPRQTAISKDSQVNQILGN